MTDRFTTIPVDPSSYRRGLHYFALFLTAWTFIVVTLGGTVKSNEAGLSIPEAFILEWLPNWWERPNLRLEFAHRMFVGALGVGVFALMLWTQIVETRPAVKRFSIYCLCGVLLNAVFGYMTVRYFAYWHTSIPHVALGHTLLGMLACFSTMLSPQWMGVTPARHETENPPLQKLARASLIMAFAQLLLGAAVRHDNKGAALQAGHDGLFYWHLSAHVLGALGLAYFVGKLLLRVFRDHREQAEIIGPARKIMLLLGVQFLLGPAAAVLKVLYSRDDLDARMPPVERQWVATSHVVAGALILALSAVLYARSKRFAAPLNAASGESVEGARTQRIAGASA